MATAKPTTAQCEPDQVSQSGHPVQVTQVTKPKPSRLLSLSFLAVGVLVVLHLLIIP